MVGFEEMDDKEECKGGQEYGRAVEGHGDGLLAEDA